MKTLKEYFEKYENVSLRRLSMVTEINYGILLKKSKQPIVGKPYDPEEINWEEVEKKLVSKGVDYTTLDWESMNEVSKRKGGSLVKDMDSFQVGMKVYLRRNNTTPYEIVYKTESHVVIMLEGTQEPQSWSNNTFLLNGPVFEPRTTTEKEVEEV